MPEKMISILTLSILKSIYILIFLILFYKLYFVATPRYFKPLLLENHIYTISLIPDLQRVSFYSTIEFFYYSFTIKLILSLILIKGSYLSFSLTIILLFAKICLY
jgi:hypothetical protein